MERRYSATFSDGARALRRPDQHAFPQPREYLGDADQIRYQIGKLTFNQPLPEIIRAQQENNGLKILPSETEHIYALQSLPLHHRDRFDRLLIA